MVRADYRTADVFRNYGINYCCGGQVTFEEACAKKGVDSEMVWKEIELATRTVSLSNNLPFTSWKIDFLIDYIVNVHHAYLTHTIPSLQINFIAFVNSHRKQYPALETASGDFDELVQLLLMHNQHEEDIIFPYIKQMDNAHRRRESYGNLFVKTLRKPLGNIENDHKKMGTLLTRLRTATNDYTFPENACTNHRVVFSKLKEFDNDLVQHKHLENNILFPKAIQLEKELLVI
jgi:regulator of cell morphogenesis and NO signaling